MKVNKEVSMMSTDRSLSELTEERLLLIKQAMLEDLQGLEEALWYPKTDIKKCLKIRKDILVLHAALLKMYKCLGDREGMKKSGSYIELHINYLGGYLFTDYILEQKKTPVLTLGLKISQDTLDE